MPYLFLIRKLWVVGYGWFMTMTKYLFRKSSYMSMSNGCVLLFLVSKCQVKVQCHKVTLVNFCVKYSPNKTKFDV